MARKQIRSNTQRLAWYYGIAAACLAIAAWFVLGSHMRWFVNWTYASLFATAAIVLIVLARKTGGFVECPSCNVMIHDIRVGNSEAVLCPWCNAYATGEGGMLDVMPPEHVANRHVLGVDLPEKISWPVACSICDQPPTRALDAKRIETEDASLGRSLAVGIASAGFLRAVDRITYSVRVPHCDAHEDGVIITRGHQRGGTELVLGFRSHSYFRKFVAANGVHPRQL